MTITTPEQMREAAMSRIDALINAANAAGLDDRKEGLRDVQQAIRAIPIAPQPATDWTTCAADMLRVWDTWFGGSADGDHAAADRLAIAASFAAQAFKHAASSGITADGAPTALLRAFLLALIDKLHPALDYLRADPASGEKARAERGVVVSQPDTDRSDILDKLEANIDTMKLAMETAGERIAELDAELAACKAQPVAVTVKPLVWKSSRVSDRHERFSANSPWGGYEALEWSDGTFGGTLPRVDCDSDSVEFSVESMSAALAYCQADYAERMKPLSADPLSDPRVVALVEAAQEQVEYLTLCGEDGDLLRNLASALRAIGGEA